jgi:hypothetical protein
MTMDGFGLLAIVGLLAGWLTTTLRLRAARREAQRERAGSRALRRYVMTHARPGVAALVARRKAA